MQNGVRNDMRGGLIGLHKKDFLLKELSETKNVVFLEFTGIQEIQRFFV
mgnify:CR=1 FL=1